VASLLIGLRARAHAGGGDDRDHLPLADPAGRRRRRLLGERVGWVGWAATVGGFAGVMLIVRPGSDIVTSGACSCSPRCC
jgi:hypothetical protein